jgi:hypothetical protein
MANAVRMRPGLRDRIITIQQRSSTDTVGSSGVPVETWTTLVSAMPASRVDQAIDIRGRETFAAGQLTSRVDTRWEINYRPDMDPELVDVPKLRRICHNARIYDIVSASVIGRREGIQLLTVASTQVAA